jgi:hypothetical protein
MNLCYPLLQDIRKNLEESLPGTGGGRNPHDQSVVKILFSLPLFMLICGYYGSCFQVKFSSCWKYFSLISWTCGLNGLSILCTIQTNKELLCIRSLCAFARRARYKYKSEEALPSYSTIGAASSSFGISHQKVDYT